MSDNQQNAADSAPLDPVSDRSTSRRRLMKAGAVLVPSILTLRARPAQAQVHDGYVYQYGTFKGGTKTSQGIMIEISNGQGGTVKCYYNGAGQLIGRDPPTARCPPTFISP